MEQRYHFVDNGAGWKLALKQTYSRSLHKKNLRPVVIVPGYGMNAFIFGYHPRGLSMEEYLAQQGFEVWSVNLRAQDPSLREGGSRDYGFEDICLHDLPLAVDYIVANNHSRRRQVDLVGCSLGGTYVYAYTALLGADKVGSLVGMGAPLRWVDINPVLRAVFGCPSLMGLVRLKGTRTLARVGLPLVAKAPFLLSIYLHPDIVDLSDPAMLTRTVEDPNPRLNREIAQWVLDRDLTVAGRNLTQAMAAVKQPLLCLVSNADGIVPASTALSALDAAGSKVKDSHMAGTDTVKMAHADLFISDYAQEQVFKPLATWLAGH